ncbi:MAG: TonB-dependent receptor domain-containing protein [Blastocatellia bacterium]
MTRRNYSTQPSLAVPARSAGGGLNLIQTVFALALWIMVAAPLCSAQTASTGALSGAITDPTGAVVPGVQIKVTSEATGETRTVTSRSDGTYVVPLLSPGSYRVEAEGKGFKRGTLSGVRVEVTETATLDVRLEVGATDETVTVNADAAVVQTESSTLGRVTDEKVVVSLPLVTRNYTQILGLSPGVTTNVTNAAEVGRGSGGTSGNFGGGVGGNGTYVHGARSYENNFQMNGVGINDLQSNGTFSGGVAIPNPDTIQAFKVQTGQYDASFGRNVGANVNVVTKGGSNAFHGALFEFFRNDALNANDFFTNRAGRKKGILRQNQFGATMGGPVVKNKLLFFGSYQGTRQGNGLANPVTVFAPALTGDRSAAAIGSLFASASQRGGNGIAIRADGTNINPIALKLLQMKLPDGSFLIPTPQTIDPSQQFARRGSSTLNIPRFFNEDQYMINLDFLHTARSKFEGRFFAARGESFSMIPAGGNTPGFPIAAKTAFRTFTLSHTYVFSSKLFNEARLGFNRTLLTQGPPSVPFRFTDLGINAPPQANDLPTISIGGSHSLSAAPVTAFIQNHYSLTDTLSYVRGPHTLRGGGDLTFSQVNTGFGAVGTINFATFADFLLGLNATQSVAQGGTATSNVLSSSSSLGLRDRAYRVRNGSLFLQDDYKVTRRLNLNLGLRYERIGHLYDKQGRNSNFDFALANPNPPATGSLAGFIVPEHFAGGSAPAGVKQLDGKLVVNGDGQNAFGPRLGFAWQVLPNSSRLALRGGYGLYYSRLASQTPFQLSFGQPFALGLTTPLGGVASFSNPFPPFPTAFPVWTPYTPTSNLSFATLAPDYRPSMTQQYSLNIQSQLAHDFLLEVGYVGTRGMHLLRTRSPNQALLASASNPIRGVTTNTVANIPQRVPFQGLATGVRLIETAGESFYNGLEASLTKRFSRGLQFLASYTFSKSLDTDAANVDATGNATNTIGDQNDPRSRYGRSAFDRAHRLVLSYVYQFPIPAERAGLYGKVLGGWGLAGVTTIQTGQALTFSALNANNVFFGSTVADRAQLSPNCTYADLTTSGGVSQRLNGYFNRACFFTPDATGALTVPVAPPAVGSGVGFGNSGVGIVEGPGQNNSDFVALKRTPLRWPTEASNLEFRAEFFNVFNHAQFANPSTGAGVAGQATFGTITATTVSPRVVQFALKLNF